MPELPEVQTVVNDLREKLIGFEIKEFSSFWKKNIGCGFLEFKKRVIGRKIKGVRRIAKFIVLDLGDEGYVVLHLRMTGQLLVIEEAFSLEDISVEKRNHVRHFWVLENKSNKIGLFFHDVRKFATIDYTRDLDNYKSFTKLGLEPFSDEFNLENLGKVFDTQKSVRSVLLDQSKIVGIGNIYVSEILFHAGIYPGRKSSELSKEDVKKIKIETVKILRKTIEKRGTTFSDYRDSKGDKGSFQKMLKVYNKRGKQCGIKSCTGIIDKETLEQRSSFWCPVCQK